MAWCFLLLPHPDPLQQPPAQPLQLLSSQPQLLPAQPQLLPAQPQLLLAQPQLLPAQPQLLPAQPQLLLAQPQLLLAQPQLLSTRPQLLIAQPQLLSTRPLPPDLCPVVCVHPQQGPGHMVVSQGCDLGVQPVVPLKFSGRTGWAQPQWRPSPSLGPPPRAVWLPCSRRVSHMTHLYQVLL